MSKKTLSLASTGHFNFLHYAPNRTTVNNLISSYPENVSFEKNRIIDEQELQSSQEAFAVNFEYFILDPEFKCRKGSIYNYLSQKLMVEPFKNYQCKDFEKSLFLRSDTQLERLIEPVIYSPKGKLYQIHYLVASPGEQLISKFGHAMFRFIYCSPDKKTADESCLKDKKFHIVFSPIGLPLDKSTGRFVTHYLADYFSNIAQVYNQVEDRDLYSIPLNLTSNQIDSLERVLFEKHWSYSSVFQPLKNNCTIEVLNTLKTVFSNNYDLIQLNTNLPYNLIYDLKSVGLTSHSTLRSLEKNEQNYFFPRESIVINKLDSFISKTLNLEVNYLEMAVYDRKKIYLDQAAKNNKSVKSTLYYLEQTRIKKLLTIVSDQFKNDHKDEKDIYLLIGDKWRVAEEFANNSGYGVPSQSEIRNRIENISKSINQATLSLSKIDKSSFRSDLEMAAKNSIEASEIIEILDYLK